MGIVKAKDGSEIHYKDWGAGQPIVFSHGWPLSSDAGTRKCCSSVSAVTA
jgi:non-heme chloroperoxidase